MDVQHQFSLDGVIPCFEALCVLDNKLAVLLVHKIGNVADFTLNTAVFPLVGFFIKEIPVLRWQQDKFDLPL